MLLQQKTTSLTPIDPKHISWYELKGLEATWLDWRWIDELLTVWTYEFGWFECYFPSDEEEELRIQLEEKWIASQYADMAYFNINMCSRGKLDA